MTNFGYNEVINVDKLIYALVIYDIVDDKKRNKLAQYLNGFGVRIQKSAFEFKLSPLAYKKLISGIGDYASDADNIRIYKMDLKLGVLNYGFECEKIPGELMIY